MQRADLDGLAAAARIANDDRCHDSAVLRGHPMAYQSDGAFYEIFRTPLCLLYEPWANVVAEVSFPRFALTRELQDLRNGEILRS